MSVRPENSSFGNLSNVSTTRTTSGDNFMVVATFLGVAVSSLGVCANVLSLVVLFKK